MACPICNDDGFVMQDIGTATIPDYISVPCKCNPEPSDMDCPDFPVAGIDFDKPFNDHLYEGL